MNIFSFMQFWENDRSVQRLTGKHLHKHTHTHTHTYPLSLPLFLGGWKMRNNSKISPVFMIDGKVFNLYILYIKNNQFHFQPSKKLLKML